MVTIPGRYGIVGALSNRVLLASCIRYSVDVLITRYVFIFALFSGFSINPAGTTGWLLCALMHNGMSLLRRAIIGNVQCSGIARLHQCRRSYSRRGFPCFRLPSRRYHAFVTSKSNTIGHFDRGFRARLFQETLLRKIC